MRLGLSSILLSCVAASAATVNVPAGGDIQAAVDSSPPGTLFQLAAGMYLMQTIQPKDGDQFIGTLDPTGNRLTVVSGAQPLTSFTKDEFGNYVATTTQTAPGQQAGYCIPDHPRCNLPEDLFYDDQPYWSTAGPPSALAPGQFFFDYPNGKIYFKPVNPSDDPTQHQVEYSRAALAFWGKAVNVTVSSMIVEKYAVPDQFGAIGGQFPPDGWIVQNNETRLNHAMGMRVGNNGQLLNNYTHDNGESGMGGMGNNILVQGNEVAHNNYSGTDHDFECGGFKFATSNGLTIRNNYSHDNTGPGMWTDISSINVLYENNTVSNNARSGIFHETSYDAIIRNNTIVNNGSFAPDDWFWNAGIQVAASRNVQVYGNLVTVNSQNNGNGIMLIQQDRSKEPCLYGPCVVINNYVHDNVIIVTGDRFHGSSGGAEDYSGQGDMFASTANNLFSGNQYYVTTLISQAYWQWGGIYAFFAQFQGFGQDVTGAEHPNTVATRWTYLRSLRTFGGQRR
jgi:parallel beta-helix repeat protein